MRSGRVHLVRATCAVVARRTIVDGPMLGGAERLLKRVARESCSMLVVVDSASTRRPSLGCAAGCPPDHSAARSERGLMLWLHIGVKSGAPSSNTASTSRSCWRSCLRSGGVSLLPRWVLKSSRKDLSRPSDLSPSRPSGSFPPRSFSRRPPTSAFLPRWVLKSSGTDVSRLPGRIPGTATTRKRRRAGYSRQDPLLRIGRATRSFPPTGGRYSSRASGIGPCRRLSNGAFVCSTASTAW
jgi:hypothetical protein